jgi:HSP20 family protein
MASGEEQFTSMTRQMAKWVDNVLGSGFSKYCPAGTWSPAVNMYEDEKFYYVVVDLAGVKVEDLDLKIEEGSLVLCGERETPRMPNCESLKLHLMEIDHGRFSRRIDLPTEVDADNTHARYRNGYLWIHIPRKL